MPKRTDDEDGFYRVLDLLFTLGRDLENENRPVRRMEMDCEHLNTPLGSVPFIVLTPFTGIVQVRAETERATFAQFGAERPWPEECRRLHKSLQGLVDAPIVYLAEAFVRVVLLHNGACVVTVGTQGKPGWSHESHFTPDVFDYLEALSEIGGCLVHIACPFDHDLELPAPKDERAISWAAIHQPGVGERALAMAKRPRERLILMLAIHLHMDPDEINRLKLAQLKQKLGRDGRLRVYLNKRLVRREAVADALLQYRRRDRESFRDPKDPMFRTGKRSPSGRSMRMGAAAIEASIVRYAERALKAMPAVPETKEPPALSPRPPMFWIPHIECQRS